MAEWSPPPSSSVKINFDAGFNHHQRTSYSEIVVRDSIGKILVSQSALHREVGSLFFTEALASLQAIRLGVRMGFSSVIVEGDSRSVIQKCNFEGFDRSKIWAIIYDIKKSKRLFQNISFRYITTSGNGLAHTIAMMV